MLKKILVATMFMAVLSSQRTLRAPVEDSSFLVTGRMREPLQHGGSLCKTVLLLSCFWGKVRNRVSAGGALTLFASMFLVALCRET